VDLGIAGKRALVCGSTAGLGYACAAALAVANVDVVLNGRSQDRLDAACGRLSAAIGRPVTGIAADVTTMAGRQRLWAAMPSPDILVTNGAGPPPGQFEDWDESRWHEALQANMVAPIMLIRDTIAAMRERRWGRVLNITSTAVKAPLPLLGLSTGARAGLTGFVSGLAREVAAHGITINNLLPGYFRTARLERYAQTLAEARAVPVDTIWAELAAKSPAGRIGDPEEFGAACAFLASRHGGFINAQNLLLDGGAFPGTL
jgi:3-oxoacyl-[acyl-carrier protein] reductase